MVQESETKSCVKCGKSVINNSGAWVHVGGGMNEQLCRSCKWSGGQIGGFSTCPRCGDGTNLVVDHTAS